MLETDLSTSEEVSEILEEVDVKREIKDKGKMI